MTKFADQLFDDLMREHGPALARTAPPAHIKRNIATRRVVLAAGGTLAVAGAVAGGLVASSGTPHAKVAGSGNPAYSVTKNPDGTITLAVYKKSGIAGADARLRQLGEGQVVVVPVEAGCPTPGSLPPPPVSAKGVKITTRSSVSSDGTVTVDAQGIPAGDILVFGAQVSGQTMVAGGVLTSAPAPSCITLPPPPGGDGGSGS